MSDNKPREAIPTSQARAKIGKILSRVELLKERVCISRHGGSVAAVIPIEDLELLEALEDRIDLEDAREALMDPERVSWADLKAELGIGTGAETK